VFGVEGGLDHWLRLPYAKPEDQLVDAVRQLARAWAKVADEPDPGRALSRPVIA